MAETRSPLSITLAVWQAIFLREALDRLFDMRAAWLWLFMEPVIHIGFIAFVFSLIRVRMVGGMDVAVWITVGMLAFFLFRRTAVQVMHAADSNRAYFTYRQVKPFDTAIARAGLEAFLMSIISTIILVLMFFLGHETVPPEPLLTMQALTGLWLLGFGYGLVSSVLMALAPEMKHILQLLMMPLYLISGTILPIASIPQPYRDMMMLNPIAHGLELVRMGFLPHYHAVASVDAGYLYAWAGGSILLGLMLYRRFALQLVMQ